jgi:monoamine oxidase
VLQTDVLIVGGGLAGLSLASHCQQRGIDYQLIEARARLGGRVLSRAIPREANTARTFHFDLGPSWFWPGQPRIARLVKQLDLQAFDQFSHGATAFEDERGQVFRNRGNASMQGAFRVAGGMGGLIEGLRARLDASRIVLGSSAQKIVQQGERLVTMLDTHQPSIQCIDSRHVALAVPPRVIAQSIDLHEIAGDHALAALRAVPTWMAAQAKVVAVYERPFWRESGWSGDAMSRCGPMVEIHDASPPEGTPDALYALFGFVGLPATSRSGQSEALLHQARQQLARLFGDAALQPVQMLLQDWAEEAHTTTALDFVPLAHHPAYGLPKALATLADGQLLLASSEVAGEFGGYLEGALCAAEAAFHKIAK